MKRMTDKDLRLYARLSDIDSDLILDSAVTAAPTPVKARGRRMETVWRVFSNPMVASLAMSTVMITLLLVVLLATGAFKTPTTTEPPAHGSYPEETTPPLLAGAPTAEAAESLRKGMSLDELESLMGSDYTVDGDCYTFTLDTGEKLTVSLAPDTSLVSGFAWLGETAKTVNPMNIPEDILQKIQEYASDKVVPLYMMESLFTEYIYINTPSVHKVLKDSVIRYLRLSTDGAIELVTVDGFGLDGAPLIEDFSLLADLSALFDESVKVKEYYLILTSTEGGSVYFRTSVGDYILYLHNATPTDPSNPSQPAVVTPYLMPTTLFHRFAYWVVSEHGDIFDPPPEQWIIPESMLEVIEPYALTSEEFQKPVNLATPEAADQVKTDTDLPTSLGLCLHCALSGNQSFSPKNPSSMLPLEHCHEYGLHYWELTDGSGLVIYCTEENSYTGPITSSTTRRSTSYRVIYAVRVNSADILDDMGTPTLATYALMDEGMAPMVVNALLGDPLEITEATEASFSMWKWLEDGQVHTAKVYWKDSYYDNDTRSTSMEHSVGTVEDAIKEIQLGMSYAAIVARLGNCLCGHEVNSFGGASRVGYHYWELPDGRCLASYIGYDIPALTNPYGSNGEYHFNMSVMHLLWLDSTAKRENIGTPSLSLAELVEMGMKEELVKTLLGAPTTHVEGVFSVWEWKEAGKTRYLTVYWKENIPVGFHQNFLTIAEYIISDAPVETPVDKTPTEADAATVTMGMTEKELLLLMGSRVEIKIGVDSAMYIWILPDSRAFCVLTEGDLANPGQPQRLVTCVFYRNSYDEVFETPPDRLEEIAVGMSMSTVYALLGSSPYKNNSYENTTWVTTSEVWWDIIVEWELQEHPETGLKRVYASSITIIK